MRAALVLLAGCSFIGVHGPPALPDPPPPPDQIHCTSDDLLPSVDALGGAAALATAVGGVIIENTSASGDPRNFTKYYMMPLIVVGIVYFVAASKGTHRVEECQAAKDRTLPPVEP